MIALSRRHKLLGSAFTVIAVTWALDTLTGGATPRPAAAAATGLVTQSVPLPGDPPDLDAVISSLSDEEAARTALPFGEVTRDLFAPTAEMTDVLVDSVLESAAAPQTQPAEPEPAPFETRHQLEAIITGRIPLALIDGRLYRQGAEIDGYRLVALQREYVVFQQGSSQVTLRVATAKTVDDTARLR